MLSTQTPSRWGKQAATSVQSASQQTQTKVTAQQQQQPAQNRTAKPSQPQPNSQQSQGNKPQQRNAGSANVTKDSSKPAQKSTTTNSASGAAPLDDNAPLPPLLLINPSYRVDVIPNVANPQQLPNITIHIPLPLLNDISISKLSLELQPQAGENGADPTLAENLSDIQKKYTQQMRVSTGIFSFDGDQHYRDFRKISKLPPNRPYQSPVEVPAPILPEKYAETYTKPTLEVTLPPRDDPTVNNNDRSIHYRGKYQFPISFSNILGWLIANQKSIIKYFPPQTNFNDLVFTSNLQAGWAGEYKVLSIKCEIKSQSDLTITTPPATTTQTPSQSTTSPASLPQQQKEKQEPKPTISPPEILPRGENVKEQNKNSINNNNNNNNNKKSVGQLPSQPTQPKPDVQIPQVKKEQQEKKAVIVAPTPKTTTTPAAAPATTSTSTLPTKPPTVRVVAPAPVPTTKVWGAKPTIAAVAPPPQPTPTTIPSIAKPEQKEVPQNKPETSTPEPAIAAPKVEAKNEFVAPVVTPAVSVEAKPETPKIVITPKPAATEEVNNQKPSITPAKQQQEVVVEGDDNKNKKQQEQQQGDKMPIIKIQPAKDNKPMRNNNKDKQQQQQQQPKTDGDNNQNDMKTNNNNKDKKNGGYNKRDNKKQPIVEEVIVEPEPPVVIVPEEPAVPVNEFHKENNVMEVLKTLTDEDVVKMSADERRKLMKDYRRKMKEIGFPPLTLAQLFPNAAQRILEQTLHAAEAQAEKEKLEAQKEKERLEEQKRLKAHENAKAEYMTIFTDADDDEMAMHELTLKNTLQNVQSALDSLTPTPSPQPTNNNNNNKKNAKKQTAPEPKKPVFDPVYKIVSNTVRPVYKACQTCYFDNKITCNHCPLLDEFNTELYDPVFAADFEKNHRIPVDIVLKYAVNLNQMNLQELHAKNGFIMNQVTRHAPPALKSASNNDVVPRGTVLPEPDATKMKIKFNLRTVFKTYDEDTLSKVEITEPLVDHYDPVFNRELIAAQAATAPQASAVTEKKAVVQDQTKKPAPEKIKVKATRTIPAHYYIQDGGNVRVVFEFKKVNAAECKVDFFDNQIKGQLHGNGNCIKFVASLPHEIVANKASMAVSAKNATVQFFMQKVDIAQNWTSVLTAVE